MIKLAATVQPPRRVSQATASRLLARPPRRPKNCAKIVQKSLKSIFFQGRVAGADGGAAQAPHNTVRICSLARSSHQCGDLAQHAGQPGLRESLQALREAWLRWHAVVLWLRPLPSAPTRTQQHSVAWCQPAGHIRQILCFAVSACSANSVRATS